MNEEHADMFAKAMEADWSEAPSQKLDFVHIMGHSLFH